MINLQTNSNKNITFDKYIQLMKLRTLVLE